ncbi:MAG: PHB depolymerase family esterase [Rhodanobacteraceae bacterium]|nr:PHB depolymerase family esterase [Pseudomonadota bacterium]
MSIVCAWAPIGLAAPPLTTGLQQNVTFDDYSPLSSGMELARRLLSPLSFQRLQHMLAAKHEAMRAQSIDLAQEKFIVYMPTGAPPKDGYGLLVFVPPWPQAELPHGWATPLDRHSVIYISAANAGNDADVIERRAPLTLLAYVNIRARYPLDGTRVYIGGMSGGARVALHIALAYPDVFHGALLDAGSDPIGTAQIPLPAADLFRQFQQSTRLVYLTGGDDQDHLRMDEASRSSLQDWCVFDVDTETMQHLGHETADATSLNRALDALEKSSRVDPDKLAQCRARVERELSAKLADAQTALTRGDRDGASKQIEAINASYGGLAAPKILELQNEFGAGR